MASYNKKKGGLRVNKDYLNSSLSPEKRTDILLGQMTLEEKVGQMMQISCMKADPKFEDGKAVGWIYGRMSDEDRNRWVTEKTAGSFLHVLGDEIDEIQQMAKATRLGIPVIFGIDAIHGHALHNGATIFPSQLAVSCSWDRNLIQEMGRVTAKEVTADGIHWTFSPVLCIARDLRWGRVDETFGEDAYLIGELGSAIIKGYQGKSLAEDDSILACAKHYLAYGESTGGRDSYDSQVSMRKIREVFLPPFKKASQVGCATFMTGYQSIDGKPVTASHKLIKQMLKSEIGFEGFVVTDWNNTESLVTQQHVASDIDHAATKTLLAGNDMIMNTPAFYESMIALVRSGKVSMAALDDAVRRILLIKFKMGLFEKVNKEIDRNSHIFSCQAHKKINLDLTRKAMVMLENKNNILPLNKAVKKLAVIGPNADDIKSQYGDWTYFTHPYPKDEVPIEEHYTMVQGIRAVAKKYDVQVTHHRGCHVWDLEDQQIEAAVAIAQESDVIIAVVGDCIEQNGEFKDRANLDLSGGQQALLENLKATGKPLIVILVNGKPLSIPWIKEHADALIETFNSGMFGGKVVGEILFGETNPTGKLSISFPYHSGQLPVYYNQLPGWHGSKYMDLPMGPLYPFGYGLSYTTFKYCNMNLSKSICGPDDEIVVSVDVTNTGKIDSEEIVQLYAHDLISSLMTPFKQLIGFERIDLKAGETKTVHIRFMTDALSIVNEEEEKVLEPGLFNIMVGPDSRDESLLIKCLEVK